MTDNFWEDFAIPYQDEDPSFDFVNAVTVSEQFIRVIEHYGELKGKAEDRIEIINDAELARDDAKKELQRLRREIFASRYGELRVSASSEQQEAFLRMAAEEDGRLQELQELEDEVDYQQRIITQATGELKVINARIQALENKVHWAEQFLNYEKYEGKIRNQIRGR